MRNSDRDVAVLGMGLTTSLGDSVEQVWMGLKQGKSGVNLIKNWPTMGLPTRFGAQVSLDVAPGRNAQERTHSLALNVMQQAMADAGLSRDQMLQSRSRLFVAFQHPTVFLNDRIVYKQALAYADNKEVELVRSRLTSAVSSVRFCQQLSDEYGINGAPLFVTTACASSSSAIQLAVESLRRREIDRAVVLAADASVTPEVLLKFNLLSALSTRNDDPSTASRPFSQDRDGFVMGEGAAALILELGADAQGCRGYIVGCGDATDNFHRTRSHPSGKAIIDCMNAALQDAEIDVSKIGYINAHGTSTPENDKMEALGVAAVFGNRSSAVPISSSKSMIGHTLSAAGAIEAAITLVSVSQGHVHPTINHGELDPGIVLDVVPNVGREVQVRYAISNSFGFGGQNASIVFRRHD